MFLGLLPLTAIDLLVCVAMGVLLFVAVEVEKLFLRGRAAGSKTTFQI